MGMSAARNALGDQARSALCGIDTASARSVSENRGVRVMRVQSAAVLLAAAFVAAPLAAQVKTRNDQVKARASAGRVIVNSDGTVARSTADVPPGQLPPKGMCRVWIDGVPPGQQPPVTDC